MTEFENAIWCGEKAKTSAKTIKIGEFFLMNDGIKFHRVRVIKTDIIQKKASCLLIDQGGKQWTDFGDLYELDLTMTQIPYRAVRFSLSHLEEYADNQKITDIASELLIGKKFAAEIKTNASEYTFQSRINLGNAKIQTILYDDSKTPEVQMNELILSEYQNDLLQPQLNGEDLINVIVTYVTNTGHIYCRSRDEEVSTMHYIEQQISEITNGNINPKHRQSPGAYSQNKVYLIYDSFTCRWYRGMIRSGTIFECIDFGMTCAMRSENIYRLDSLNIRLSKYPPQAIKVQFANPKSTRQDIIGRLQTLLPPGSSAKLQVFSMNGSVTSANIWVNFIATGQCYSDLPQLIDVIRLAELEKYVNSVFKAFLSTFTLKIFFVSSAKRKWTLWNIRSFRVNPGFSRWSGLPDVTKFSDLLIDTIYLTK